MSLYWLCYRHSNQISVVIEPAHSLIYARLRAAIDGLDQGEFTEGHELPGKWKVSKEMWATGYRKSKPRGCWGSSTKGNRQAGAICHRLLATCRSTSSSLENIVQSAARRYRSMIQGRVPK